MAELWPFKFMKGVLCQALKFNYFKPYQAVKQGETVYLGCTFGNETRRQQNTIKWHKLGESSTAAEWAKEIITMFEGTHFWLRIKKAKKIHSGIYYCRSHLVNNSNHQCGSEVNVITKPINKEKLKGSQTIKDMLIIMQAILLVLCLTLPAMLFLNMSNQAKKSEEAETYHMYEGLEVMQTAMYEDIGNMRPTEAKWTVGEQPKE
ncbi:B-cell antigen receptor complex-associated protein beta chain-like isoform X2 [Heterodontus francisci]|uniref:B-cell antigen receptor complex-associated protein beta chain-like isoform X2 n=1 Tax=Heterodontus francisci TaxID=7792 RepID=UPI00355B32DF